jgi:hypothetical protein
MKNRYFPQYFRAKRPYYNNSFVADVYKAASNPRVPVVGFVRDTILASARDAGLAKDVNEQHFLYRESPIAQTLVTLEWNETPLYDISPALLEALANSDPGDMRLADLRSPNHLYYLHWGPQADLLLHGKHPVEGAIVATIQDQWHVAIVARTGETWLSMSESDNFMLKFPQAARMLPFEQAVDRAIEAELQEIQEVFASSQEGRSSWGMTSATRDRMQEDLKANAPSLKQALALAGNCMAYLTAYPGDSRFDWEVDTPATMLVKLTHGAKEAARTTSKLRNMGFLQIHRVGLDFQHSLEAATQSRHSPSGLDVEASRRPHWRRGHWRHQAHGPQNMQRKLLWVRPTRVLGGPAMSHV